MKSCLPGGWVVHSGVLTQECDLPTQGESTGLSGHPCPTPPTDHSIKGFIIIAHLGIARGLLHLKSCLITE